MTYPFVHAANDYGRMTATPLALIIHMAEGGGTVGYLARDPARGVSVHFVIEYGGTIVQMLAWDHAAGSINPQDIRTTDDPAGPYGISSAVAVMGGYARNPNAASWSVEIEGFAKDGPNAKQVAALNVLVRDCESRAATGMLGHRDFQDYKPCPGQKIPWDLLGGHGSSTTAGGNQPAGDDMRFVNAVTPVVSTRLLNVGKGSPWKYLDGSDGGAFASAQALTWVGAGDGHGGQHVVQITTAGPYSDGQTRPTLVLVTSTNKPYDAPAPVVPPAADCAQAIADGVAAEHERVRTAAIKAVEAI